MKNEYTRVKHEKTTDTSEPKTCKAKLWSITSLLWGAFATTECACAFKWCCYVSMCVSEISLNDDGEGGDQ